MVAKNGRQCADMHTPSEAMDEQERGGDGLWTCSRWCREQVQVPALCNNPMGLLYVWENNGSWAGAGVEHFIAVLH